MGSQSHNTRRTLLCALPAGLAASAIPVWAKPTAPIILKAPPGSVRVDPPPAAKVTVTGESNIRVGSRGEAITAPDRPIARAAALAHFNVGFHNGDHKFRHLRLLVESENSVKVAFADQNGDDPFEADARWINLSDGRSGLVSGQGHGRAVTRKALRQYQDHVFALRGFEFRRNPGTDANIRHLAIRYRNNMLEVLLSDDEGIDFRFDGGGAGGRVLGAALLDPHAGLDTLIREQFRGRSGQGRPYDFAVQYVWIPKELVASTGMVTGSERGMRDAARVPPGRAVLSGFSFSFLNSDHHLLTLTASTLNGGMGRFRDNNEDDPVRWSIEYVALRG